MKLYSPYRLLITLSTAAMLAACGPQSSTTNPLDIPGSDPLPPDLTFAVTPEAVALNTSASLAWTTSNATNCLASADWSGSRGTSGNELTLPATKAATYTLTCTGPGGSVSRTVNVGISQPQLILSADTNIVPTNGTTTLHWSSTSATACTASGDWTGNRDISGNAITDPITGPSSFTLTCTGPGGSVAETVQVSNTSTQLPPELTLSASPQMVDINTGAALNWSSTNATSCEASGSWNGTRGISGNEATGPLSQSSIYTLTCTGPGGSTSATVNVDISVPQLSFSATSSAVDPNGSTVLNWSTSNATVCTASGGWSGNKSISGSESVTLGDTDTDYLLQCTGPGGTVNNSVTISVNGSPAAAIDEKIEGYGAATTGGEGGETCHVTTLADSGTGSLRDCITNRNMSGSNYVPRLIVFDLGGEIRLFSDLAINTPFLTIDGGTAPSPGITIRKTNYNDGEVRIDTSGPSSGHDLIVRHIRFDGEWDLLDQNTGQTTATINIDGEDELNATYNIVLDHITVLRATDAGPDIWGDVHNVTYQWCLIYNSLHPTTVTYSNEVLERKRITFHHNVYAYNHERNPQIRGNVYDLDFRNNIIFNWKRFAGGYGVRLRERNGVYPTEINFVNNFFSSVQAPGYALILGDNPGDAPNPYPGNVYIAGNKLPTENVDSTGTVASEIAVPEYAKVTTQTLPEMVTESLPLVGMKYRTPEEQSIIDEIRSSMQNELGL